MIKYFSEILSKFTKGQRIFVLTILLLSLIIITLGPVYINTIRPDNKGLWDRINNQEKQIESLNIDSRNKNVKILDLSNQIIINQQECTDRLLNRENEIIGEISNIQKKIKTTNTNRTPASLENYQMVIYDSLGNETRVARDVIVNDNDIKKDNTKFVIDGLEKLKKKIKSIRSN